MNHSGPFGRSCKEYENGDKTLVTTHHSKAVSNKSSFNTDDLGQRSHEEADYRMMLYVADMLSKTSQKSELSVMIQICWDFPGFLSRHYKFRTTLDNFWNRKS